MKRLLLAVPVLLAGCATPLTPARVSPSFEEVFTGRYVEQQRLLGRAVDAASLHATAACQRTGSDADGPGEDWLCGVRYSDQRTAGAQSFELQVKADGCWRADGAPATQPAAVVDARTRETRPNPLAEFDGCLDTSW